MAWSAEIHGDCLAFRWSMIHGIHALLRHNTRIPSNLDVENLCRSMGKLWETHGNDVQIAKCMQMCIFPHLCWNRTGGAMAQKVAITGAFSYSGRTKLGVVAGRQTIQELLDTQIYLGRNHGKISDTQQNIPKKYWINPLKWSKRKLKRNPSIFPWNWIHEFLLVNPPRRPWRESAKA